MPVEVLRDYITHRIATGSIRRWCLGRSQGVSKLDMVELFLFTASTRCHCTRAYIQQKSVTLGFS